MHLLLYIQQYMCLRETQKNHEYLHLQQQYKISYDMYVQSSNSDTVLLTTF